MLLRTAPFLVLLVAPGVASAATLNVCGACTYKTVGAAVTAATAGDTISVAAGSYNEDAGITIAKNLTITGAGSATTTLTRSSAATTAADLIDVTSGAVVTMSGLTLKMAGSYKASYRMVDIASSTFTGSDLKLSPHEAGVYGAGFQVSSGTLTLSNSTIDDVDATGGNWGGAIYAYYSTLTLTSVTIQSSDADSAGGGAIYFSSTNSTITSSTFSKNVSLEGGAFYLYYSNVDVTGSTFSANAATSTYGGDARVNTSTLDIASSTFTGGSAPSEGGSLAIRNGSSGTITGSSFSNGTAALGGNVLSYGDLTITDSTFDGGTASSAGGNLYLWSDGDYDDWVIDGSSFTGGSSASGAGIYATGVGNLDLTDSTLSGNKATSAGGAVSLNSTYDADLQRNTICSNSAPTGGGVYASALSTSNTHLFTNNLLVENTATGVAGNLYITTSTTVDVLNNDILGGTGPAGLGGGAYVSGDIDFDNNLVGWTTAGDGLVGISTTAGIATYNLWYSNTTNNASGTVTLSSGAGNVTGSSPLLYDYTVGSACKLDYYPYQYTSPLRNAGTGTDLDGTTADIGVAGGAYADPAYWDDGDADGYDYVYDCNDASASVKPGATETCNSVDDDCDGSVDEGIVWYRDADGDGYGTSATTSTACPMPSGYVAVSGDCNDGDNTAYPSATETCDGVDDDCDGTIDDGVKSTWYADSDADGYGSTTSTASACTAPTGYIADHTDCNDASASVHPGASETCNSVDDDCDGSTDEGVTTTYYRDADTDGYGSPSITKSACSAPSGYVTDSTDCDDTDAWINPKGLETCNAKDDDCDGTVDDGVKTTYYRDADGDGYGTKSSSSDACSAPSGYVADATDCNDGASGVHPGVTETCDDVDQDCDGTVDDSPTDPTTWYADADGDGYGDASSTTASCDMPANYAANDDDCDDADTNRRPGAPEQCNSEDDDCDGTVDEPAELVYTDWYADADGDGFGEAGSASINDCRAPAGTVDNEGDCDDTDPAVNPGEEEVCNGVDDDCDGTIDVDAADPTIWFVDADGDGVGDGGIFVEQCDAPDGFVAVDGDCDDANESAFPGANECTNGYDDDCDGQIDEDVIETTWYADADDDGFGDETATETSCEQPPGYVAEPGDCDDDDAAAFPGAEEVWYDGVDEACDGGSDYDQDGDGFDADDFTGDDCDDVDPAVNPGATEIEGNEVDEDCDGSLGSAPEQSSRTWDAEVDELPDQGKGCSCDGSAGISPAWGLGLLLLTLRRPR